jgi:hypothetical protein
MANGPFVIAHTPDNHCFVNLSEVINHEWYPIGSSSVYPSTIRDYVRRDGQNFLKSTSKWNEPHLNAFKALCLYDLEPSRIVPAGVIPHEGSDRVFDFVRTHVSASEDEIRQGAYSLDIATSFYSQLKVVLRRPRLRASPIPILIPIQPRQQSSIVVQSSNNPASTSRMSTDSSDHPSSVHETQSTEISIHGSSEDKAESATNQMAVTFLDLLCQIEQKLNQHPSRRITFR